MRERTRSLILSPLQFSVFYIIIEDPKGYNLFRLRFLERKMVFMLYHTQPISGYLKPASGPTWWASAAYPCAPWRRSCETGVW